MGDIMEAMDSLKRSVSLEEKIYRTAERIRLRVMEHTIRNKGGYLSQACSAGEIFSALYLNILNMGDVDKPIIPGSFPGVPGPCNKDYATGSVYNGIKSREYDRFILSPSQYSLVLYAALIEVGRMYSGGLEMFNRDGSVVEMIGAEHSPGMEVMTGSLGQGISQAAGIAMGRKLKGEKGRVVLFMSDGECQSGQFWEAVQAMSYHRLDNMLAYVDMNGYQCDGKMTSVMNIEPFDKRLEAFGARVYKINGNNANELVAHGRLEGDGRPIFVLCYTDPCRGIDILKQRIPKLHYVRFTSEDERERYRVEFEKLMTMAGEEVL
jgi:transketolase